MRVTSQPPFEKTVAPVRNVTWLMTASLKTASLRTFRMSASHTALPFSSL